MKVMTWWKLQKFEKCQGPVRSLKRVYKHWSLFVVQRR